MGRVMMSTISAPLVGKCLGRLVWVVMLVDALVAALQSQLDLEGITFPLIWVPLTYAESGHKTDEAPTKLLEACKRTEETSRRPTWKVSHPAGSGVLAQAFFTRSSGFETFRLLLAFRTHSGKYRARVAHNRLQEAQGRFVLIFFWFESV